jgi:Putative DNA-binding domain
VKNPYIQPLESFTFHEMVDALDAISSETGRLDFKEQMIPRTELAYRACSFGNADGGLIVVGIKDPVEGHPLEFGPPPKTDDNERLRVMALINSRVYPALALDVMGYRSVDNTNAVLVIRIGFSTMAPHEYTGGPEFHNLPVRRGTATSRLTLAEIEMLRLRRTEGFNKSPITPKRQPYFGIQPGHHKDGYVGLFVRPRFYLAKRRIMDGADDRLCSKIAADTCGERSRIHSEMELRGLPDSNVLTIKQWQKRHYSRSPTGSMIYYEGPPEQMEIFSDGDIFIRMSQKDGDVSTQFNHVLLFGYAVAQEIFYRFALRPEAHFHVIARFDDRRLDGVTPATDAYEDSFDVELATQGFSDAFFDTVVRFHRTGDGSVDRDTIREVLDGYSYVLPLGDELRPRWLSG